MKESGLFLPAFLYLSDDGDEDRYQLLGLRAQVPYGAAGIDINLRKENSVSEPDLW
jgi:hypothetical protein